MSRLVHIVSRKRYKIENNPKQKTSFCWVLSPWHIKSQSSWISKFLNIHIILLRIEDLLNKYNLIPYEIWLKIIHCEVMHWRRQRKYSKHFGKSYFLKTETNVKFEFSRGFSAVPVCFKSANLYFRLSTPSRGRVNFCQKIKSSTFTLFINSIKVKIYFFYLYIVVVDLIDVS